MATGGEDEERCAMESLGEEGGATRRLSTWGRALEAGESTGEVIHVLNCYQSPQTYAPCA